MFRPFKLLENILYFIRDSFWRYPDIFFGRSSIANMLKNVYIVSMPLSHFVLAVITFTLAASYVVFVPYSTLFGQENVLIEGVIMGSDLNGKVQRLGKINPLLPSNIQLEKDVTEMIYEPLIRYEYQSQGDGTYRVTIENILVERVIKIREGADYQLLLKKSVYWHDGQQFDADDVVTTFNIVSQIDEQRSNAYVQALKQIHWEKVDKFTIRICTKVEDSEINKCDESEDNPILSNFLELISIKIIPEHLTGDISNTSIHTASPTLFRSPVGTGKYKFKSIGEHDLILERNLGYYEKLPEKYFHQLKFVFYKNFENAAEALQNGEIHTLASVSVEHKSDLENYSYINTNLSPVLYNQFWALYFNLRTDPNGNALGPEFLLDDKIRKAISMSINKQNIIERALLNVGEETYGPIPKISYYFNEGVDWFEYDPQPAIKILEDAGWYKVTGSKYRQNIDGEELKFSLYFVDSFDRWNIAKIIKQDLEQIGINAVIDRREQPGQDSSATAPAGWSLSELNNQILAPRLFDTLLYGMNTFIDPDRYELFHSSQQKHPGLNIAGYTGSVETVRPKKERSADDESSLERLPKVDQLLEITRGFDPENDKESRKKNYDIIQELINDDAPIFFLYHPQFLYYTNKRLENVDLTDIYSVESRFRNLDSWEMK